jgi:tRNA (Thr-GGU) A37 N-methylase
MIDPTSEQLVSQPQMPSVAFTLRPIGLVHTTLRKRTKFPKYFVPRGHATLELFYPYIPGLQGLYGGIELWVLTYHAPSGKIPADSWQGGDGVPGVFTTNAIERPNPIEFLRARVIELNPDKGLLHVEGLDVEDGAPILDLRPVTTPHHRLVLPSEK